MPDLYRATIQFEQFWVKHWPLERGRYIMSRVHRLLYKLRVLAPRWVTVGNGQELFLDSRDYIAQHLFLSGAFEPKVQSVIAELLPQDGVFLDVGANIGVMSLAAAALPGFRGRVLAVEPSPQQRHVMIKNIARNHLQHIEVLGVALGTKAETLKLFISSTSNQGRNSLVAENAGSVNSVDVQVVQGDALLREMKIALIDLVKIDVEGAEPMVLMGLKDTLERDHPPIIIEFIDRQLAHFGSSKAELKQWLSNIGYNSFRKIDNVNELVMRTIAAAPQ
jgi:FkbM family methyltransferase